MQVDLAAFRPRMRVLLCSMFLFAAKPVDAASVRLSQLIEQKGTITSGDKLFSDFSYAATGDMPFDENVNVIPFQDADGNYGIRFQGAFLDSPDPNNQGSDALITYKVAVTDPSQKISSAHVAANIVAKGTGTGTVTETFFPELTGVGDYLRIPSDDEQLVNWIHFDPPRTWLPVQKNILLRAVESQVDISFIDQTFGQVPEPAAVTWLAAGLLATAARRRRPR